MRYVYDHDFHIHSKLSGCSNDPLQSNERILKYAEDNGLKKIVLTDHYWDENIKLKFPSAYANSNTPYIKQALPRPQGKHTQFLFGAESDMDMTKTIGVSKERFNEFDFVIIPTTHLHFKGFTISEEDAASVERIAKLWVERFNALLNMDLPFKKMGIAHLVCALIAPSSREGLIEVLNLLPENELKRLFSKASVSTMTLVFLAQRLRKVRFAVSCRS